jgi:hypothetical protein
LDKEKLPLLSLYTLCKLVSMPFSSSGLFHENAEKSLALASTLFPGEEWVLKEPNIWVAKSRLPEEYREPGKWEREMSQQPVALVGIFVQAPLAPEQKYPDSRAAYAV